MWEKRINTFLQGPTTLSPSLPPTRCLPHFLCCLPLLSLPPVPSPSSSPSSIPPTLFPISPSLPPYHSRLTFTLSRLAREARNLPSALVTTERRIRFSRVRVQNASSKFKMRVQSSKCEFTRASSKLSKGPQYEAIERRDNIRECHEKRTESFIRPPPAERALEIHDGSQSPRKCRAPGRLRRDKRRGARDPPTRGEPRASGAAPAGPSGGPRGKRA